jgi:hypothetical protein
MTIFGTADIMVDRPHSFYLQYAHAFGIPALFLLLSVVLYYFYQSVTLLRRATSVDWSWTLAAACFAACLGFALTGLCNDSMIGPSTVFWVLLGVGHAANRQLLKGFEPSLSRAVGNSGRAALDQVGGVFIWPICRVFFSKKKRECH